VFRRGGLTPDLFSLVFAFEGLQSSTREEPMMIVVIGGTGLIGSKTVAILRQRGHDVVRW
jgi:hypothetical protein